MVSNIEEERLALRSSLADVSEWLRSIGSYTRWNGLTPFDEDQLTVDVEYVTALRNRAASSLLKVAFIGEMSSGKSFLVSALHRQLKYELILDEKSRPKEKYSGLLPSFTEPTSACPVTVEPVSVDDGTTPSVNLNVRFADANRQEWIADNPSTPLVTAYLTERIQERKDVHQHRVVAEAQLLVPATDMPAKLYDLPGLNAPGRRHEMNARRGWHEADCFVYVTPATHTLKASELELITELYGHYQVASGRKKIFWVVTAIDIALDLTDNNIERWRNSVRRNTEYLREFLRSAGITDPGFVGAGFIGVSPALEARAEFRRGTDVLASEEDMAESRMDELRRALLQVVDEGAGARHLAVVAAEAADRLGRYERPLRDMLASATTPYAQLQGEISALKRSINYLRPLPDLLREKFGNRLKTEVERTVSAFGERHGLGRHLHDQLDNHIRSANLLSPRGVSELEIRKTRLIREWIAADGGPETAWEQQLRQLGEQLDQHVREALSHSYPNDEAPSYQKLDLERLTISRGERTQAQQDDLAQKTAGIMAAVFPMAGAVTTAIGAATAASGLTGSAAGAATAGATTGAATIAGITVTASTAVGLALAPVGIVMAAAGLYAWRRHHRLRQSSLEVMRAEEIKALDGDALEAGKWFTVSTLAIGDDLIELAAERVARRTEELREMVARRTDRLNSPESHRDREHIKSLSDMCEQASVLQITLGCHGLRHHALVDDTVAAP